MSFKIHSKQTAPSESVPVLEGLEKHIGFIPNLIGVLAESPMAITSVAAVNQAIEQSALSPVEQRVVTITTSVENSCSYCVPAQSTMAKMAEMPDEILEQIRSGESLSDKKLEALHVFTLKLITNKGWVPENDLQAFVDAGYTTGQVLEVITLVSLMNLTNYVGHISSLPLDNAFLPQQWNKQQRQSA
jgi:uncharacterized peroxidase-related enzyme